MENPPPINVILMDPDADWYTATTSVAYARRRATDLKWASSIRWMRKWTNRSGRRDYGYVLNAQKHGMDPTLGMATRGLASIVFRCKLDRLTTAARLHAHGKQDDDICWWCASTVEPQTREHLLRRCPTWKAHTDVFWQKIANASGDVYTSTNDVFLDERLTHLVIALFESTSIGRWPTNLQKQGAGGGGDDDVDVDDVVGMDAEDDGVMPDGAAGAGE